AIFSCTSVLSTNGLVSGNSKAARVTCKVMLESDMAVLGRGRDAKRGAALLTMACQQGRCPKPENAPLATGASVDLSACREESNHCSQDDSSHGHGNTRLPGGSMKPLPPLAL